VAQGIRDKDASAGSITIDVQSGSFDPMTVDNTWTKRGEGITRIPSYMMLKEQEAKEGGGSGIMLGLGGGLGGGGGGGSSLFVTGGGGGGGGGGGSARSGGASPASPVGRSVNHLHLVQLVDAGQSQTLARPAAPLAACIQRHPCTTTDRNWLAQQLLLRDRKTNLRLIVNNK